MNEMTNDKWINIDEVAEYLSVKPVTIRDWFSKGKDVPTKIVNSGNSSISN